MNSKDFDYKKDLKEKLPELKQIEGFPIAQDKDIISLSEPPYYTACPNPYIADFIKEYGKPYNEATDDYHSEPYVGDVSEGKRHPYYMMHSYSTKVPHKAIMQYINHYTKENDIILDAFAGSGMSGLAAQSSKRYSILTDLSPSATFISRNNNYGIFEKNALLEIRDLITSTEDELGKIFILPDGSIVNYYIWNEVFLCPYCNSEILFWDSFVNPITEEINDFGHCSHCNANDLKKGNLKKYLKNNCAVFKPVIASIFSGKSKFKRKLTESEVEFVLKNEDIPIPYYFPINDITEGHNLNQPKKSHNFKRINDFYFNSSLIILSKFWDFAQKSKYKSFVMFFVSSMLSMRCTKRMPYRPKGLSAGTVNNLSIPSLIQQYSPIEVAKRKLNKDFKKALAINENKKEVFISTQSATDLSNIPNNSIDYIFTDPPFGDNIMYSDMNFISESWLKLFTNTSDEAIVNHSQNKDTHSYKQLMIKSFNEYFRVLKPKRWITVEFNNSKSIIWNNIRESINKAGFIICQVSVLDKKMGRFKQVSSVNSVEKDLVISAFKPSIFFQNRFLKQAGENLEVDFIKEFIDNILPRPIIERTDKMLYSKARAYYVQNGYEVNLDSKSFYSLLQNNFIQEDGYWFTPKQISSYREFKQKMKLEGIEDIKQGAMMLFVTDEYSALLWLYNFLFEPKTFSQISTAFTQLSEIQGDNVPDLKQMLDENFVFENEKYRRPQAEAEKTSITDKRERALMRVFESILIEASNSKKKISLVRKEALLHGFETCYKQNRFEDILVIANRLDSSIIENSTELTDFIEIARIKVEGIK